MAADSTFERNTGNKALTKKQEGDQKKEQKKDQKKDQKNNRSGLGVCARGGRTNTNSQRHSKRKVKGRKKEKEKRIGQVLKAKEEREKVCERERSKREFSPPFFVRISVFHVFSSVVLCLLLSG